MEELFYLELIQVDPGKILVTETDTLFKIL